MLLSHKKILPRLEMGLLCWHYACNLAGIICQTLSDPTIVCPSEFANANETGLMNTPPSLVPITSRPNLSSCYGPLEKLWLDEMQKKKPCN